MFKRSCRSIALLLSVVLLLVTVLPAIAEDIVPAEALVLSEVQASATQIEVGDTVTFTVVGSGGTGTVSAHYRVYISGVAYEALGWMTENVLDYTFNEPGSYTMEVRLKDSTEARSEYVQSAVITVSGGEDALTLNSVTASATSVNKGDSVTFTVSSSGGTGTVSYHYRVYRGTAAYQTIGWQTATSQTVTFDQSGEYRMEVRAKDSTEARSEYVFSETVTVVSSGEDEDDTEVLMLNSVTSDKTSVGVGEAVVFTADVTGGVGELQYHYRVYKGSEIYQTIGWTSSGTQSVTFADAGIYSMQVRVKDSTEARSEYVHSNSVTVTAEADPLVLNSVTADSYSVTSGTAVTFTADATGGTGNLQYHFRVYKDGAEYQAIGWQTTNVQTVTFTEAGSYVMTVRAKDSLEYRSEYVSSDVVTVAPASVVLNGVNVSKTGAEIGEAVDFTADASGGTGSLKYHFRLYKDGEVYDTLGWLDTATVSYTFTEAGVYKMTVRAKDVLEYRSEYVDSADVIVGSNVLMLESVTVDTASAEVGSPVTFTANTIGGTEPLQYHFRLYTADNRVVDSFGWLDSNVFEYTFTQIGTFRMQVRAKDSTDARSDYVLSEIVTIEPGAIPVIVSIDADKSTANIGETVTFTVNSVGGTEPMQYHYRVYKGSEIYQTIGWTDSATCAVTVADEGSYMLQVRVKDSLENRSGYVFSKSVVFELGAGVYGEFAFEPNDDATGIVITGYLGTSASVIVPEMIANLPIVKIGDSAFENNTALVEIDLPDTVEVIGVRAFAGCIALAKMS